MIIYHPGKMNELIHFSHNLISKFNVQSHIQNLASKFICYRVCQQPRITLAAFWNRFYQCNLSWSLSLQEIIIIPSCVDCHVIFSSSIQLSFWAYKHLFQMLSHVETVLLKLISHCFDGWQCQNILNTLPDA